MAIKNVLDHLKQFPDLDDAVTLDHLWDDAIKKLVADEATRRDFPADRRKAEWDATFAPDALQNIEALRILVERRLK